VRTIAVEGVIPDRVQYKNGMTMRLTQLIRVLMFCGVILCLRWQHERFVQRQLSEANWLDVMPILREILPTADSVRAKADDVALSDVLDSNGIVLGSAARTSPLANHILGFSGPTDMLLIFDQNDRLIAARIVSSRDTSEHVQQVLQDPKFLSSLTGRSREQLLEPYDIDAVTGATLTSFAILESIRIRMSQTGVFGKEMVRFSSLKFRDLPRLTDVQLLYGDAATIAQDAGSSVLWRVLDADKKIIGQLLRAAAVTDNNVGYQGPTDLLIAFDKNNVVTGIAVGFSYDNEPYVGYVCEDEYFRTLFNDRSLQELTAMDANQVEGVSGATMTSQALTRSLQMTAQAFVDEMKQREAVVVDRAVQSPAIPIEKFLTLRNLSTIGISIFGIVLGFTHLRGRRWLRISFQVILIGWLGLLNGDMVSQALLLGWAQSGIPWQNAFGLTFLTAAALLIPMTARRNVYCAQLCPHGAVQQLVRNRLPWRLKLSRTASHWLSWIPGLLILYVVLVGMLHLPFSVVAIEPFDAWLWNIAGFATVAIAVVGLVASLFVPMAYCRFGCPTGALLDYFGSSSGKSWNRRDTASAILLVAAIAMIWF